jgi:hypothetical protein
MTLLTTKTTKMEVPTLPNDIIMRIIREADGGFHTHKKKFQRCLEPIEAVGAQISHWTNSDDTKCDYNMLMEYFLYTFLKWNVLNEGVYKTM